MTQAKQPDSPAAPTCHNCPKPASARPAQCQGQCQPPRYPLAMPADLTRLAFGRRDPQTGLTAWQEALRAKLVELINLPLDRLKAWPPVWRIIHAEERRDHRLTKLSFTSLDGQEVPAYLLSPTGGGKRPGVLVCHGHGQGARSAAGVQESQDGQAAVGLELARAGFVALCPELISLGERQIPPLPDPTGRRTHELFANFAMEIGRPIVMLHLMELLQALAVLKLQPEVDAGRLGVAGHSQGGRLSYLVAALDRDVTACLVASGLTSILAVDRGFQHLHDAIPGLLAWADYPDLAGLVAPRPLMLSWGRQETFPYCQEVERRVSASYLEAIYQAAGNADGVETVLHPGGHRYELASAIAFFRQHLPLGADGP